MKMINILDMKDLRNLNLFSKITGVNTRYSFSYNNALIFCVPRQFVTKAMGKDSINLKRMNEILKKRIRVIIQPRSIEDIKPFIEKVINPLKFQSIEIKDNEVIIDAGRMNKAALIGREKRRLIEMQKIIKVLFKKDFKII